MSSPPQEPSRAARATVALPSPREAASRASVYRNRRKERPRDRLLRVLGLVGTLLVHLVVLFGAILGPAYEPIESEAPSSAPLQVRLIEKKKEEPPPPPPVRGTPPKEVGPVRKAGGAPAVVRTRRASSSSTRTDADIAPVPVPALETPVVVVKAHPAAPKPEPVAAPRPAVTLPKPSPAPELQPVPTSVEPPQVSLETPPAPQPVPPKFQPEPVRKAQAEGTQPMPPPASLALPDVPAQSAPQVSAPTIAMEHAVPKLAPPSPPQAIRAETVAAPSEPELQAVPLPAQAAPTVNLQAQSSATTAVVPREQPRIQAPSIRVAEAELEAVPLPENARPSLDKPQAPRLETAAPKAVAVDQKPSLERPQIQPEPATAEAAKAASQQAAANAASQAASTATGPQSSAPASAAASTESGRSSAPNATPQGSEAGTPGASPNGVAVSPGGPGKSGLNLSLPPGQGSGPGGGSSGQGQKEGLAGDYVQLQPRGNTEIMEHRAPNIGYKSTRFEKDWTPEGESSLDTALRRAVEKTTVRHTFHLPRGVRVECVVMPLFPVGLFGCGNGDPPPKPVDDKVYERMKLAPANPLVPPASAASTAPAAPIKLDNSAQCATAKVSGGPLPPGCVDDRLPAGSAAPAKAASSWVPASDQFH